MNTQLNNKSLLNETRFKQFVIQFNTHNKNQKCLAAMQATQKHVLDNKKFAAQLLIGIGSPSEAK